MAQLSLVGVGKWLWIRQSRNAVTAAFACECKLPKGLLAKSGRSSEGAFELRHESVPLGYLLAAEEKHRVIELLKRKIKVLNSLIYVARRH